MPIHAAGSTRIGRTRPGLAPADELGNLRLPTMNAQSRWLLFLRSPLGVLTTAAVTSLLCGIFVASHALTLSFLLGTVLLLGIAWPWIAMRAVRGMVEFRTRRGVENFPVDVHAVVRNRWPMPVWGLTIEGPQDRVTDASDASCTALATVRAHTTNHFHCSFVPTKRGIYPRGPLFLSTEFPFGIWKARRALEVQGKTIIWPQLAKLPFEPRCLGEPTWDGTQSSTRRTGSGEPEDVRAYRSGDSPRAIHWPLTARYDTLMVRQSTPLIRPHATILLHVVPDTDDPSQLAAEAAIRIAASLARRLIDSGSHITFDCGTTRHHLNSSNSSWQSLMDSLAELSIAPRRPGNPHQALHASTVYHVTNDGLATPPEGAHLILLTRKDANPPSRRPASRSDASHARIIIHADDLSLANPFAPVVPTVQPHFASHVTL